MRVQQERRWGINNKVFMENFAVACLSELSQVGAGLIDGIITSRMLSAAAMAAFGVAHPIFSILAIFTGLFSTGMQTMTSQALGKGNIKECNRLFCATVYIAFSFALAAMVCVLLTADKIAFVLGASGKGAYLLGGASAYIRGIALGIPAWFLNSVLSPAIQMDSGRKRVLASVNVDSVCDIVFDFAAVFMGGGLFSIGLATSLARYFRLAVLMMHFREESHFLHFVPLQTSFREFFHLISFGTEKAWRRLGNVIRPVFINRTIMFYGGAIAMTAMSIHGNITNFTEIFAVGLADTVGLLTGIYYGEKNEEAQINMGRTAHKVCTVFCGAASVILILFADPIARFYTPEGGDVLTLTSFAIFAVALQCPLQALVRSRISYLQRIQRNKNMRNLIMLSTVVYPIIAALLLGISFGAHGVLLCYTFSDLLSLLTVWLYYAVARQRFVPLPQDYLNLPPEHKINPGDIISLDIRNMEDVSLVSEQIGLFCKGHGLEKKIAGQASVCFEEIAANTVKHGFPLQTKEVPMIDLRVVISDGKLIIRMQDNCPKYDLGTRIAELNKADLEEKQANLGTWLSQSLADDIRYVYSFETNTVFLEFNSAISEY